MESDPDRSASRLRVTYDLRGPWADAPALARSIALEQTVELPEGTFSDEIEREVVGRVESLTTGTGETARAVISYAAGTFGGEIPQLLNLLFGNISLKLGIRISRVDWPSDWLGRFAGPRWGIAGLRSLCGVEQRRPLVCSALKPLGLAPQELARLCAELATGGIDVIKDDHGLADQPNAPFAERVQRCQEALTRANVRTGGRSLYFPNVSAPADELDQRVGLARDAGCRGVLISPMVVGPDAVRSLVDRHDLAVIAHPALAGAYFHADHGIGPDVLLGQIFRILGSDAVIYPNAGGRFPLDEATCSAINDRLRGPLGSLRPSFPVPAGGIDVDRVPHWIRRYGPDTIFLIGGSLFAKPDLVRASRALINAVRETETP